MQSDAAAVAFFLLISVLTVAAICVLAVWIHRRQERKILGGLGWLAPRIRLDGDRFSHAGERFKLLVSGESSAFNVLLLADDAYPKRFAPTGGRRRVHQRLPKITLRREGAVARGGKAAGIIGEFQTGDPRFDDAVFVDTQAPEEFLREVLGRQQIRASVLALLADWPAVALYDQAGPARLLSVDVAPTGEDPARFCRQLDHLIAIRDALPPVGVVSARQGISLGAATSIASALLAMGAMLWMFSADLRWPLLETSLLPDARRAAIVIWLACMGPIFLILRGRSNSLRSLVATGICLLAALVMAADPSARWLNAALDTSEAASVRLSITDHRFNVNDGATYYYITPGETEHTGGQEIEVRRQVYEAAKAEGALELQIRSGALGARWIASFGVD